MELWPTKCGTRFPITSVLTPHPSSLIGRQASENLPFDDQSAGIGNTLAEWLRGLVGRPSLAVMWRGDFTTAWEGRPTSFG